MKIESIIKRANGHTAEIDGEKYTFNKSNDYTCEVVDKQHISRFMQIPEGYRIPNKQDQSDFDDRSDTELRPSEEARENSPLVAKSTPRRGRPRRKKG
jgi:hypothetical protein